MFPIDLTAKDRLVLIRVKIERAKKHLKEFEAEAAYFRGQDVHVIGPHYNPESGRSEKALAPLPTLPFNVLATSGDVIQNLRSALDHLAWHLAQVGLIANRAGSIEPNHDVAFPIAPSVDVYEARKGRKVQGMLPEAVQAIDSLKPYKGGYDPLWMLHELNNIDKHRNLFTVSHDHLFTGEGFFGDYWLKTDNPLFDGIIQRVVDPKSYEDLYFGRKKSLAELRVAKSEPLLPTLQNLTEIVDNIIAGFEPLLE